MNHARILFHLVRASFLERVRRQNFLVVMLGATLMSLAIAAGRLVLRLDVYLGEYNSAWAGTLVAGSTTVLLCFANFFIVKNAIELDGDTGIGELVAATPMSKFTYLLGKVLSNFAVLIAIEGILFASTIVIQLFHGETQVDWLALFLPFVFIALPAMAAISALALLFETLPGLRSSFGNLLFVFLWFYIVFRMMAYDEIWFDLPGVLYVNSVFTAAAQTMEIPFDGGFSVEGGTLADTSARFVRWENVNWINEMVGWRLYWFGVAVGLTILATIFFDRFDSSRISPRLFRWPRRKVSREPGHGHDFEGYETGEKEISVSQTSPKALLAPVVTTSGLRRFGGILWLELRMISKQSWWWRLILLWMFIMSLAAPVTNARSLWVPLIWLWLAIALSSAGIRDARHHTEQVVFSTPHPLRYQFFATWLAGVILTLCTGLSGARLWLAGESEAALAWGIAAIFIPTFALAAGVLSRNQRLFEGVYCAWWLMGPMASKGTGLDFMGVHPEVVARGIHWYYLAFTILLLVVAVVGRQRQLSS
ncbi:MAG: hypothetical protein JW963_17980 [Anaerolineales bacterium]|nr:hypothetical protein [Anaerolineales bacterium]